jgi:RP/EB family microtubule-associated protein
MANRSVGRASSAVGMMEGAFFVSRTELIQWANDLLQVSLTKVEQCANACVYCQIVDSCFPGSVGMKKLNWMARADHEYIPNYKVLQAAFDKNGIEKHIEVEKLSRGKYQDNLEFLQFMKYFWEREGSGRHDYDPIQAREGKTLPPWARSFDASAGGVQPVERKVNKENQRPSTAGRDNVVKKTAPAVSGPKTPRTSVTAPPSNTALDRENSQLRQKVEQQNDELEELRGTLDGLERERDYYFAKLRDVEILCTTLQARMDPDLTPSKLVKDVQGILYSEQDQDDAAVA